METLNEYDMYLQKYLDQGIRGDITLFTEIFKNKLYYYKSERRWVKYNNGVWENVVGNEPLDEILEIAKIYERDFLKFSKEVQVLSEELYGKNKDFIARFFYKESINNDNCFKKKQIILYALQEYCRLLKKRYTLLRTYRRIRSIINNVIKKNGPLVNN